MKVNEHLFNSFDQSIVQSFVFVVFFVVVVGVLLVLLVSSILSQSPECSVAVLLCNELFVLLFKGETLCVLAFTSFR